MILVFYSNVRLLITTHGNVLNVLLGTNWMQTDSVSWIIVVHSMEPFVHNVVQDMITFKDFVDQDVRSSLHKIFVSHADPDINSTPTINASLKFKVVPVIMVTYVFNVKLGWCWSMEDAFPNIVKIILKPILLSVFSAIPDFISWTQVCVTPKTVSISTQPIGHANNVRPLLLTDSISFKTKAYVSLKNVLPIKSRIMSADNVNLTTIMFINYKSSTDHKLAF